MENMERVLIGGRAMIALGSSRNTSDINYLVNDTSTKEMFIHKDGVDYVNANGHNFIKAVWKLEKGRQIASPQSLLDLKAFAFVQHCQNGNWKKMNDCEYDMRFLVLEFGLTEVKTVRKYLHEGELQEVQKVLNAARRGMHGTAAS